MSSFVFLTLLFAALGSFVSPPGCRQWLQLLVNNDVVTSISLEGLSPLYILSLVERRGYGCVTSNATALRCFLMVFFSSLTA